MVSSVTRPFREHGWKRSEPLVNWQRIRLADFVPWRSKYVSRESAMTTGYTGHK